MKLFTFDGAPHPRRVDIFLKEKNIQIEKVQVNLLARENRSPEFIAGKNIMGGLPVLELDNGTHIAESVAICRYLDALNPSNSLFGATPAELGVIEMWIRRMELYFMMPVGMIWIHGSPMTAAVIKNQIPEVAKQNKYLVKNIFETLNSELSKRKFIAGENYTMADIVALTTYDFGVQMQLIKPADDFEHVVRWHEEVSARDSAS